LNLFLPFFVFCFVSLFFFALPPPSAFKTKTICVQNDLTVIIIIRDQAGEYKTQARRLLLDFEDTA